MKYISEFLPVLGAGILGVIIGFCTLYLYGEEMNMVKPIAIDGHTSDWFEAWGKCSGRYLKKMKQTGLNACYTGVLLGCRSHTPLKNRICMKRGLIACGSIGLKPKFSKPKPKKIPKPKYKGPVWSVPSGYSFFKKPKAL